MSEIHYQSQLNEDEQKSSNHAKVHPSDVERSRWDKKRSDNSTNDQEIFDGPEPKTFF